MTSKYTNKASKSVNSKTVSNLIYQGVRTVVSRRSSPWVGTMTQLDTLLQNKVSTPEILPGSASALRVALNKVVRRLRNDGIDVRFTRDTSHNRTRLVQISIR